MTLTCTLKMVNFVFMYILHNFFLKQREKIGSYFQPIERIPLKS